LRAAHVAPRPTGARPATLADFDLLAGLVPSLGLTPSEIHKLASKSQVYETPAGTALLKQGEAGHPVYFILAGRAVAGTPTGEGEHEGEHFLQPGDFFGENAALDQPHRATNVVAAEPTSLLEAPPAILKHRIAHPSWRELIRHKLHERHGPRVHITDLPRVAGFHPEVLHALRQPHPTDQPAPKNHSSNSHNEFS
jgi:CRP-like cAMP-binding protein